MPQSLSRVLVHLVFSTKNRAPVLTKEIRQQLNPYFIGILRNEGCPPLAIGSVEDHVHLLFSLSRTKTIAEVTSELKTGTAKWIKKSWAAQESFAWQGGYGAISANPNEIGPLLTYIETQEQHHKKFSFKEEFLTLLVGAGIEYDERCVWD